MNVKKLGLTLQLLVSLTIFGQTVQFQRYLQSIVAREVNYFDRELFEIKTNDGNGLGFCLRWIEYNATIKCQTKNQEINCWEAHLYITTVYSITKGPEIGNSSEDLSLSPEIESSTSFARQFSRGN